MHPDFGAPGCAAGTAATPSSPCFRSCSHPPAVSAGKLCKTKSSTHFHTLNFFGGRGWITRAAHLKKPRRGFFPRRTVRRVDAVRIHPPSLREGYYKTENPVPGSDTGFLGGRGWITRAAHLKKPRRGFFARRTIRRADAVRIHPPSESSFVAKQKPQRTFIR